MSVEQTPHFSLESGHFERLAIFHASEHFIDPSFITRELGPILNSSRYLSLGRFSMTESGLTPISNLPAPELFNPDSPHLSFAQKELNQPNSSPTTFVWLMHLDEPVEYKKDLLSEAELSPGWYMGILNATHNSEITWGAVPLPNMDTPAELVNTLNQSASQAHHLTSVEPHFQETIWSFTHPISLDPPTMLETIGVSEHLPSSHHLPLGYSPEVLYVTQAETGEYRRVFFDSNSGHWVLADSLVSDSASYHRQLDKDKALNQAINTHLTTGQTVVLTDSPDVLSPHTSDKEGTDFVQQVLTISQTEMTAQYIYTDQPAPPGFSTINPISSPTPLPSLLLDFWFLPPTESESIFSFPPQSLSILPPHDSETTLPPNQVSPPLSKPTGRLETELFVKPVTLTLAPAFLARTFLDEPTPPSVGQPQSLRKTETTTVFLPRSISITIPPKLTPTLSHLIQSSPPLIFTEPLFPPHTTQKTADSVTQSVSLPSFSEPASFSISPLPDAYPAPIETPPVTFTLAPTPEIPNPSPLPVISTTIYTGSIDLAPTTPPAITISPNHSETGETPSSVPPIDMFDSGQPPPGLSTSTQPIAVTSPELGEIISPNPPEDTHDAGQPPPTTETPPITPPPLTIPLLYITAESPTQLSSDSKSIASDDRDNITTLNASDKAATTPEVTSTRHFGDGIHETDGQVTSTTHSTQPIAVTSQPIVHRSKVGQTALERPTHHKPHKSPASIEPPTTTQDIATTTTMSNVPLDSVAHEIPDLAPADSTTLTTPTESVADHPLSTDDHSRTSTSQTINLPSQSEPVTQMTEDLVAVATTETTTDQLLTPDSTPDTSLELVRSEVHTELPVSTPDLVTATSLDFVTHKTPNPAPVAVNTSTTDHSVLPRVTTPPAIYSHLSQPDHTTQTTESVEVISTSENPTGVWAHFERAIQYTLKETNALNSAFHNGSATVHQGDCLIDIVHDPLENVFHVTITNVVTLESETRTYTVDNQPASLGHSTAQASLSLGTTGEHETVSQILHKQEQIQEAVYIPR